MNSLLCLASETAACLPACFFLMMVDTISKDALGVWLWVSPAIVNGVVFLLRTGWSDQKIAFDAICLNTFVAFLLFSCVGVLGLVFLYLVGQ